MNPPGTYRVSVPRSGLFDPGFDYSDMSGAAEPVRWAMELAGLEWTDRRLSKEDFAALKPREWTM